MNIAAWRIDSEEERFLAAEADVNEAAREKYVRFYRENEPVYYSKGLEMIERVLGCFRPGIAPETKKQYIIDMVYSLHRFGCMYDEYFLLGFEKLNTAGRESFLTDKNRWDYYRRLNSERSRAIFNDKSETYKAFSQFYGRELLSISNEQDYDAFREFRKRHPSFIIKPILGTGGRGTRIYRGAESDETVFQRILSDGAVVIEELIQQVEAMQALHPKSLNTLRIPTVLTKKGVHVFQPFLRVGVGEAEVDNAASGGIICPIDVETGIVKQFGVTEMGKRFIRHPDSGIVLPGFQIPEWKEAKRFVDTLARVIPENHYVGWDCALTPNGWVMVEGNAQGQFVTQYVTQEGCRLELDQLMESL